VKVFVPMLAAHAGIRDQDLLEEDVRPFLLREIDLEGFEAYRRRVLRVLEAQGRALREASRGGRPRGGG
jgi:hypothetical protein